MKKKILFICPYPIDTVPGQRLKYEQYFETFKNSGYEVTVYPFFSEAVYRNLYKKNKFFIKVFGVLFGFVKRILTIFILRKYNVVYIFLNVVPLGKNLIEKLYVLVSKKIIYDIDDLVYLLETSKENWFVKKFKSSKKYEFLIKNANYVITCTNYLDNYVKKINKNSLNIPSTVDTKKYIPSVFIKKNKKDIVLGWTGSFSTYPYLDLIKDPLNKIIEKHGCKFNLICSVKEKTEIKNCKFVQWSSSKEVNQIKKIDIGLYPLPNYEWVNGKSGLKAIQFMSLGIPVIATNNKVNKRVIKHNQTGYLAEDFDDWYHYMDLIIRNNALRKYLSTCAKKYAQKYFSVNYNKRKYLNVLKKVS